MTEKIIGWFVSADSVSEPAAEELDKTIQRTRHGGSVDILARVDAREYRYQADWVKYLRPVYGEPKSDAAPDPNPAAGFAFIAGRRQN